MWDAAFGRAVPYDTKGADPALVGEFIASGVEVGPDDAFWFHEDLKVRPAHQHLLEHLRDFTPEWASGVCDVPVHTIRRVANEFLAEARIGETIEIWGLTLPFRPVAIMLGKGVNNGWGAYECVWARTVLQLLVGALEVPGGLLGSTARITAKSSNRLASCIPGEDGFMSYPFLPTDKSLAKHSGNASRP